MINYDYPNNSEDYVHRIGRTGRRDNTGYSFTFFTQANAPKAKDLIKVLEEAKQNVPEALRKMVYYGGSNGKGGRGRSGGNGRRPGGAGFKRSNNFSGVGDAKRPRYDNHTSNGYGANRW